MSCRLGFAVISMSVAVTAISSLAAGTAPTSSPSNSAPRAVLAMKIVVAEVKGLVQVRASEDAPWQVAKVGMELNEGAEFRTGPRSSVTCEIPPDQTLTLDRLGTVKIAEAIKSGNKIKTDMIMKYGRTSYDIETAGAEHESTIRSPSSTLAVRGTSVSLYDQPPFTPQADSFHGRASFRNAQRELRFGGKTFTQVANDKNSAADTALSRQTVDPRYSAAARTASENAYIADQTSRGAIFGFDSNSQIPIVRDGPGPLTDAQLAAAVPTLPGNLDIVMRWTGNANLNLFVAPEAGNPNTIFNSPTGLQPNEVLYPGVGLNHSPSGGTIPYDDRGGPRGGMEIAFWNGGFPQGVYGVSAIHVSGGLADVKFNIFLDGKALPLESLQVDSSSNLALDPNGFPVLIKNTQLERLVGPVKNPPPPFGIGPNSGVAALVALIPPVPAIDDPLPQEPPLTLQPIDQTQNPTPTVKKSASLHRNTNSAPPAHPVILSPGGQRVQAQTGRH